MNSKIVVNIRSVSALFPGQGVASAFREHCAMAKKLPADRFCIRVNSFRRADIVHCHSVEPWNLLYMRFFCKTSVMHCHFLPSTLKGSLHLPRWLMWLFSRYVIHFYKLADRLVVVNPSFIPKLTELGISAGRIVYIPNYVAREGFFPFSEKERAAAREELNIAPGHFTVLGVGQIMARKGVDDFLGVARSMPDTDFIWCGGFPFGILTDEYAAMKAVMNNPPPNVRFTGIVPRDRMNSYYNACDLFFLPSLDELFPMCILEAAAAGRPVLLRDLPLYDRILKGLCARETDNAGFAAQIRRIQTEPEYTAALKKDSAEINRMYSETAILKILEDFYGGL